MRNKSHHAGFTLIELMVTIAVAAIIVSVAVPSFSSFMKKNRITTATNNLVSDINVARSEAIKIGKPVILCISADPGAASPTCGGTSRVWTSGWLMFESGDANKTYTAGTDRLIRVTGANTSEVYLLANSEGADYIAYEADGTIDPPTNFASTILAICDARGKDFGRQIRIKPTGRPRLVTAESITPPANFCTGAT